MNGEEGDSLRETVYLLRSSANAERLLAADAALRRDEGITVELDRD
ncbi:MAG: antitoxin YefM [Micrococcales bacterium]|nr:antitoxin YefM [Micrococcales bacterium]